jgi:hypothetical protein
MGVLRCKLSPRIAKISHKHRPSKPQSRKKTSSQKFPPNFLSSSHIPQHTIIIFETGSLIHEKRRFHICRSIALLHTGVLRTIQWAFYNPGFCSAKCDVSILGSLCAHNFFWKDRMRRAAETRERGGRGGIADSSGARQLGELGDEGGMGDWWEMSMEGRFSMPKLHWPRHRPSWKAFQPI